MVFSLHFVSVTYNNSCLFVYLFPLRNTMVAWLLMLDSVHLSATNSLLLHILCLAHTKKHCGVLLLFEDADTFRAVARVATHTILAACGLEHSKSSARTISSPKCKHPEQFRELRKSNLMPNSCRECFYSFAEDVVNSIFIEKMGPRNIKLHNTNSAP